MVPWERIALVLAGLISSASIFIASCATTTHSEMKEDISTIQSSICTEDDCEKLREISYDNTLAIRELTILAKEREKDITNINKNVEKINDKLDEIQSQQ